MRSSSNIAIQQLASLFDDGVFSKILLHLDHHVPARRVLHPYAPPPLLDRLIFFRALSRKSCGRRPAAIVASRCRDAADRIRKWIGGNRVLHPATLAGESGKVSLAVVFTHRRGGPLRARHIGQRTCCVARIPVGCRLRCIRIAIRAARGKCARRQAGTRFSSNAGRARKGPFDDNHDRTSARLRSRMDGPNALRPFRRFVVRGCRTKPETGFFCHRCGRWPRPASWTATSPRPAAT